MKTITRSSVFLASISRISIALIAIASFFFISKISKSQNNTMPLIAIANYGPHSSLEESIRGIKKGLIKQGFEEGRNIRFEIVDVSFDTSLIIQMLVRLKAMNPKIIVTQATPVSQAAKNMIKNIPIVFADITDPVEAGLIKKHDQAESNITGASDRQDLSAMLKFIRKLLPKANRIGMLYATSEANDAALLKMMEEAVSIENMDLVAVPIDQSRDIAVRMQALKGKVDMIYVGSSGTIQPSLPTIVALAEEMKIPVVNMNSEEVTNNKVFASFGVSYFKVGVNASEIIGRILKGEKPSDINPLYPILSDHEAFISRKRAEKIGFVIPGNISNLQIVE